jgi:hypothetical protein
MPANDGEGKALGAKRIEYPLAAIATAMGDDVQMVDVAEVVLHERFENVFLVANDGNSNETHGGVFERARIQSVSPAVFPAELAFLLREARNL